MVERIKEREFGFLFEHSETKYMRRYMSFGTERELKEYIARTQPLDCYISVAYYDHPRKREGWKGADLFFDLDCAENLKRARADAETVYEVLLDDFALERVVMNFSGAKGYHVLVLDEASQHLDKYPRREIIDYLKIKYQIETLDAAASSDVHRLRRLEGTRNSKTGNLCRVVKASFEQGLESAKMKYIPYPGRPQVFKREKIIYDSQGNQSFICDRCGQVRHIQQGYPLQSKGDQCLYVCSSCLKAQHSDPEGQDSCRACGMKFQSQNDLTEHRKWCNKLHQLQAQEARKRMQGK